MARGFLMGGLLLLALGTFGGALTGLAATVQFMNNAWTAVSQLRIGDRVVAADMLYVEINDNANPAGPVFAYLSNPATGDEVRLTLVQVAAGVYRFQNLAPNNVYLVPAVGAPILTDNRLEVNPGDVIRVFYTNPGDPTITAEATATAVLGPVNLYDGPASYAYLRGTFDGPTAIQDAINQAAVVPTLGTPRVVVGPGTYYAGVNVNVANLTLEGAGSDRTTIEAGLPIQISADYVTVRRFRVRPTTPGNPCIHIPAATRTGLTIEENELDASGSGGNGIRFNGPVNQVVIRNNRVHSCLSGIDFFGTVKVCRIEGNLIEENRDHGVFFEAAAENVSIVGNTIRNNNTDNDGTGSGIRFGPAAVALRVITIADNAIEKNLHGIDIWLTGGSLGDLIVSGNSIRNHWNLDRDGTGILARAAAATVFTRVRVTNNEISGNVYGIWLDANTRGFEIVNNFILVNRRGVRVDNKQNRINYNDIVGNTEWGVYGQAIAGGLTEMVDAENNWWGHSTGPWHGSLSPTAQGDKVTDHVDFRPFLSATTVPQATIEVRDASIPPTGTGTVEIWFTGSNLGELQIGPNSKLTFSNAAKVDVLAVDGVAPYQVLAQAYSETAGVGTLVFTVSLKAGESPRSGPIARVTVKGTGTAGDVVQMTLAPVPVDKCQDVNGNPITHAVQNGTLTLSAAAQIKGDVNGDGKVDITDARWAAEAAIGMRTLTPTQFAAADVAPPFGTVDITDARWIAEAAVGLRTLAVPMPANPIAGGRAAIGLEAGVLQITGASVSDVQGRILYNPAAVSITNLVGVNGFEVLAWRDDRAAGVVLFAATRLNGGSSGGVVQVHSRGDAASLSVVLDVLRGPDGRDIPLGTAAAPGLLWVGNTPNPVTDVNTTYFQVKASVPVVEIRVWLYDLAGRLVWDSGWGPNGLAWHLNDLRGATVANGVYLYQVQVKLQGLETVVASGLQKLAVYR